MRIIRTIGVVFVATLCAATLASAADAQKTSTVTIKQLMTLIVAPASNAVFRAAGEPPKSDADWKALQGQALTLWELANTLTAANRSKDRNQWLKDAQDFQQESRKAFDAAMAKNIDKLGELSDTLYTTCANCHEHYLPKQ